MRMQFVLKEDNIPVGYINIDMKKYMIWGMDCVRNLE